MEGSSNDYTISPSQGEDPEELAKQTTELVDRGKWRLYNNGKGLVRQFEFKTFGACWAFMNVVAAECKTQKHHPRWENEYNKTRIWWTTHAPRGLSGKDVRMARFCDEAAWEAGEVVST